MSPVLRDAFFIFKMVLLAAVGMTSSITAAMCFWMAWRHPNKPSIDKPSAIRTDGSSSVYIGRPSRSGDVDNGSYIGYKVE